MRITVHNLGVLKEATIDLKPLTIFIGPNNSGKTWLAYALVGVLGTHGSREYAQAYAEKQVAPLHVIERAIEQVQVEGAATIDLYQFAKNDGEQYFNNVAAYAPNWMDKFLSAQLVSFENMNIMLRLTESQSAFLSRVRQYFQRTNIAVGPQGSQLTMLKNRDDDKISIYTAIETQDVEEAEVQIAEKIPEEEIRRRLINLVSVAFRRSLYPQMYVFPTERTFLVTGRFNTRIDTSALPYITGKTREVIAELAKEIVSKIPLEKQNSVPRGTILSTPVSFFVDLLEKLFKYGSKEKAARDKAAKNNKRIRQYIDFADILEKQILSGGVNFSTPEPDPSRGILFQPEQGINLEISAASSMAKELSSLVLYLRQLAQPDELLVIDEPEMNLHPEAQVKMIEFLAMLVNAGLNVVLTTHSPYITDHLTNLIKASTVEDEEAASDNFFLKRTDAFISREKVAVYGFGEDTAKDVLTGEGFIDLNTFGEVSDQVSNIYFAL